MTVHAPIPDYAAARQAMVDTQLRPQGVSDPAVIAAMALVPRETVRARRAKAAGLCRPRVPLGEGRALPAARRARPAADRACAAARRARARGRGVDRLSARARRSARGDGASKRRHSLQARETGRIVEGPLSRAKRRALRHHPDRRRGRRYSGSSWSISLKDGGRLGGAIVDRGITRLIVGRQPGGGFGYRDDRRRGHAGLARLPAAAGLHLLELRSVPLVIRNIAIATLAAALLPARRRPTRCARRWCRPTTANPTMTAQREALKATDATSRSPAPRGRPQVSATVGVNPRPDSQRRFDTGQQGPVLTGGVDVSYPLFSGGSVRNQIKAAKTRVEAGRATLRAVEGDVFTEAVAAYMDVIRDRAIVELNQNKVQVPDDQPARRRATGSRSATSPGPTSPSPKRGCRSARSRAGSPQGRLSASEENYRRVIGQKPGTLQPPPPLPPLPATPEEAVRIALASNPDLIAIDQPGAGRRAVTSMSLARTRLPTVSAIGSGRYTDYLGPGETSSALRRSVARRRPASASRRASRSTRAAFPAARIRQAQAFEGQILEQRVGTERSVVANTRSAFASYQAAPRRDPVEPGRGRRPTSWRWRAPAPSNSVGTRTILDVLNAEQELLNSQVAAGDRAPRRLCRRLPAAERDGPGRSRRPRARRRPALRPARQLPPRRRRLERLVGRSRRSTRSRPAR